MRVMRIVILTMSETLNLQGETLKMRKLNTCLVPIFGLRSFEVERSHGS